MRKTTTLAENFHAACNALRSLRHVSQKPEPQTMNVNIEINQAELKHVREYLTAERQGDAYSADAGDTVHMICRRVGTAAADKTAKRKSGTCFACGCTHTDPCQPPCSWADATETLCNACADA